MRKSKVQSINAKYNPTEIEARWPRSAKASQGKQNVYSPTLIESRWQDVWEKNKIYSPNLDTAEKPFGRAQGKPFYNLMMFPYPSAEGMHVGNMYAFTGADVYGRFQRMRGNSVFEPIGLDGFGIHSENYAIKAGKHPVEQAKISEKNFYSQLHRIGNGFDWTRTVETYKPEYYKWTQWLFIQLFKAGLAYRKKAPVNFCPSCKTVLADEQVLDGKCERCESEVVKRDLEQWFFKITKYADRLLNGLSQIDWSEKVKIAQKMWIGRSEGTRIRFKIKDLRLKNNNDNEIEVFTTRPDTLYGATFIVLAPEHPVSEAIRDSKIRAYIEKAKEIQKDLEKEKEKTGVFTGLYAINPLNGEGIPVWIADYAVMEYGMGALFGDAHDERDVAFAKKYNIPLKPTLKTGHTDKDKRIKNLEECFTGYGILFDSGEFSGLTSEEAIVKVNSWLEKKGMGGKEKTYHLRDWLISRQRYWGPPIPMVYCQGCADQGKSWFSEYSENSVNQKLRNSDNQKIRSTESSELSEMAGWYPEENLPVLLPFIKDYKPLGTGKAPLASHPEFYRTKCPKCGEKAKRETDVSDTFFDSSWYFLRYLTTEWNDIPFPMPKSKIKNQKSKVIGNRKLEIRDSARRAAWLPVDMYIGGAEHSVLHLLYSRFITMALKDMGFIDFEEPFIKFRVHGLIVKDGAKMSKSKGNVVIPDSNIKKFGADTLRTYLMFMGPFSQGGDFRDTGIEGMHRFLKRIWTLFSAGSAASLPPAFADASAGRPANSSAARPSKLEERSGVGCSSSGATRLRIMHKTIKKVTEDISNLSYNTSIAALMEWYNFLSNQKSITQEELETFLKLLAPFAPHVSEELYQLLIPTQSGSGNRKEFSSIHTSIWPTYDAKFLLEEEVVIVAQVNGKLRGNVIVKSEKIKVKNYVEDLAKRDPNVAKHLGAKQIKKVIYIEGKVINFVV